jgi:hypothetical protein
MRKHRTALRHSAIECLEVRGLLSVAVPLGQAPLVPADASRIVADVSTSAADRQAALDEAGESLLSEQSRADRPGTGKILAPSSTSRSATAASAESRRLTSQDDPMRVLVGPLESLLRNASDPESSAGRGESASGTVEGPALGPVNDAAESLSAGSSAGFAAGSAPVVRGAPAGRSWWLEDRIGTGQGGSTVRAAPTFRPDIASRVGPEVQIEPAALDGDAAELSASTLDARREPRAAAWGDLVEGALRSDWDAVDRELRRFLAGHVRRGAVADRASAAPSWQLLLGAGAVMILASTAGPGPGRLLRPRSHSDRGAPGRDAGTVGPWPLSLP